MSPKGTPNGSRFRYGILYRLPKTSVPEIEYGLWVSAHCFRSARLDGPRPERLPANAWCIPYAYNVPAMTDRAWRTAASSPPFNMIARERALSQLSPGVACHT